MRKKLNKDTKITSTSDITLGDIVDAVTGEGEGRENIKKIVKSVVRPCAIGGVPTYQAPDGAYGRATKGRDVGNVGDIVDDGNTVRFRNGVLADGVTCPAAGAGAGGEPASSPEFVMFADEGRGKSRRSARDVTASKWYNAVLQNGEVWTPYTCRRFLPAQYLHLMQSANSIDAAIARRYSMRDVFRLLDTEIEKLIFMSNHWRTAYEERRLFLPLDTVREIFEQYLDGLHENVNERGKCTFNKKRGEYWRDIQGMGRTVLWTERTTTKDGDDGAFSKTTAIEPTEWLVSLNEKIATARRKLRACSTYGEFLTLLREYMPKVGMGTFRDSEGMYRNWLPKAWKEAFKRQGAYYTLKSLIVNRHVRYTTESGSWNRKVTETADTPREGLVKLRGLLSSDAPAYVIHAILKKSIEASKLNVAKFLRACFR